MENKRQYRRSERHEKRQRFSIRKFNVGVASVAVAAFWMVGGQAAASETTETVVTDAITEVVETPAEETPVADEEPAAEPVAEVAADEAPVAEVAEEAPVEETAAPVEEAKEEPAAEEKEEESTPVAETRSATPAEETAEATVETRVAATTYRVQYVSEETGEVVKQENYSAVEETTNPVGEPHTFNVNINLEVPAGYEAVSATNNAGTEFAIVNNAIAAAIVEKDNSTRNIKVAVRRDETAASNNNQEGYTALRASATGSAIVQNGSAIVNVQRAYITTNNDETAPTAWGFTVVFDTSKTQEGDTTTISTTNLWDLGAGFGRGTEIKAADGTTIGTVTDIKYTNSTNHGSEGERSRGTNLDPYWGQRVSDGLTYDQRVNENPAVPNETGTYTYTITWNDQAKFYVGTTYTAENLTAAGYIKPAVSEDTVYTANISVDGQPVVESTYTNKATNPVSQKQPTSANLVANNGLTYVNNDLTNKTDTIELRTDSDIRYGEGSTFTIKLPDDSFTYFNELGELKAVSSTDGITYELADRNQGIVANENNVWIFNDGRDSTFTLTPTLVSPTELVLTVTDGYIQEGSRVSINLANFGLEKALTNTTFNYGNVTYNDRGFITGENLGTAETAATLTTSGGTSVNGEPEDVSTSVPNGWRIDASVSDSSAAQTAAVAMTLVDTDGNIIGYLPTNYDGTANINPDGSYDTTNILGNPYDVTSLEPEIVKMVDTEEYYLVNLPPVGPTGTLNISPQRVGDIFTPEEIEANGLNPYAYVNNVIYTYAKKTIEEEVNRVIKFVYADDVIDESLRGTEVFPDELQTVKYTADASVIEVDGKPVVEIDENQKPVYKEWVAVDGTDLPAIEVPVKPGYKANVAVVPVQSTTATDEDYEYIVYYTNDEQKATTTFVFKDAADAVKANEPGFDPIEEVGTANSPLTKAEEIQAKIDEAKKLGYELIDNNYPADGTFDDDAAVDQAFEVVLKERVVPVTPEDETPVPGQPVDPTDPNSPVWPTELEALTDEVVRTITYVYEDGTPVLGEDGQPLTRTETVTFKRTATVNLVTGEVVYSDWSAPAELPEVVSPAITNHTITSVTVDGTEVGGENAPVATVQALDNDINVVVVYTKDSGKATTVIEYLDAAGNVKTIENNDPIVEEGKVETPLAKADEIADIIAAAEKAGYAFVSNNYPTEGALTQEEQNFKVVVQERIEEVPNDAVPGQPVDPSNPNSPVWPDTIADLKFEDEVVRTITFVYEDGTPVLGEDGQPLTRTETVTFTRTAKVNLVTGELEISDWSAPAELPEVVSPAITNHTITSVTVDGTEVGGENAPAATVAAEQADINVVVVYTRNSSKATTVIKYLDAAGSEKTDLTEQIAEEGKVEDPLTKAGDIADIIAAAEKAGYAFVSNNYPTDGSFTPEEQNFEVVVQERVEEVPNDAVPGQPVDPNNPNSPVWPDTIADLVREDVVTRTITYVYEDGTTASETVTETVTFTRTAKVNLVTGVVEYGEWSPAQDLAEVTSPVISGYLANKASVPAATVVAEQDDINEEVIYTPLGSWIPQLPEGETPVDPTVYPNDPTDPTKPGTDKPTVPYVPGYTPVDPNGNPLQPVDPEDPTKGYIVPDIPVDPSQDTPIPYVKNGQQVAKVNYIEEGTGKALRISDLVVGPAGVEIANPTAPRVEELLKAGYELVVNPFDTTTFIFDNESDEGLDVPTQIIDVVFKERIVDVPTDVVPGQPVDPTDPNSPVWPDTLKDLVREDVVTRVINYVYDDGTPVLDENGEPVVYIEEVTFTRTAQVNLVTGEIIYGEWSEAVELDTVESPIVEGYLADRDIVDGVLVNAGDEDLEEFVVYTPLGSWVPNLPEGATPVDPIVYPNDPTDPTVPGTDKPTVPYVPGYTPVDPNGNPLQPVDPTDPTKGYIVPDLPADPSQDTPINYVKDPQKATITFITENGVELAVIPEEGESFDPISPVAYNDKLVELHKAGYEVITDEFGGNQNFDGDKDVDQAFKVIVKERVIPVTPEAVPGQPVDPTDPNSPVWPDTVKDLVTTKEVTRTITYVNEKGETVFETVTQTATFTREATVNLVTGEIVYGEWTPAQDLAEVVSPELARHTPNTPVVEVVTVDAETGDIVVEVVYVFNPITEFVDEEGNPVAPTEDGVVDPKVIDGYEFVTTITDENGDVKHVYKKVVTPVEEKPETPAPAKPAPAPVAPSCPAPAKPAKPEAAPEYVAETLPNTGEESNIAAATGMAMLVSALGLAGIRRRKED